jgi:hypothetical protein
MLPSEFIVLECTVPAFLSQLSQLSQLSRLYSPSGMAVELPDLADFPHIPFHIPLSIFLIFTFLRGRSAT